PEFRADTGNRPPPNECYMNRVTLLVMLAWLSNACGGDSPSEPTATDSNLREAPSTAHTVTNGDVTVKFWFEMMPPPGAVVGTEGEFSVQVFCRRSRAESLQ